MEKQEIIKEAVEESTDEVQNAFQITGNTSDVLTSVILSTDIGKSILQAYIDGLKEPGDFTLVGNYHLVRK